MADIQHGRRRRIGSLLLACLFGASLHAQLRKPVAVRGTYSNPKPFWDKGARLDEYGVNAIFVGAGSIHSALVRRAASEGAKVYAEFPTLNGKDYVEKHPEAWPINERGEPVSAATWFLGACPTEAGFKAYRLKQLADLLENHDIGGVWMDYFHWHAQFEDPSPILPETCFSRTCIAGFESATGIRVPAGTTAEKARWILRNVDREWRDWRCSVLVEWARDVRRIIREKRPDALLGVYHCPWTDEEFQGARRRILGLDFDRLAEVVDVFSPMVYHRRMGRPPDWVGAYISWFSKRLNIQPDRVPKVWPIVQAHHDPGVIPADEFEKVLTFGVSAEATGIMMFTIGSVAEDDAKMAVLKRLYLEWSGEGD